MFGSSKPKSDIQQERQHDKVDTIIGAGTVFVGDIRVKGTLRIDGRVEGKVDCAGDLVVGDAGVVEAEVHSRSIKLGGTIKGNIFVTGTMDIAGTGKLYGDMTAGKVVIADGAIFHGQCNMQAPEIGIQKKGIESTPVAKG